VTAQQEEFRIPGVKVCKLCFGFHQLFTFFFFGWIFSRNCENKVGTTNGHHFFVVDRAELQ